MLLLCELPPPALKSVLDEFEIEFEIEIVYDSQRHPVRTAWPPSTLFGYTVLVAIAVPVSHPVSKPALQRYLLIASNVYGNYKPYLGPPYITDLLARIKKDVVPGSWNVQVDGRESNNLILLQEDIRCRIVELATAE